MYRAKRENIWVAVGQRLYSVGERPVGTKDIGRHQSNMISLTVSLIVIPRFLLLTGVEYWCFCGLLVVFHTRIPYCHGYARQWLYLSDGHSVTVSILIVTIWSSLCSISRFRISLGSHLCTGNRTSVIFRIENQVSVSVQISLLIWCVARLSFTI